MDLIRRHLVWAALAVSLWPGTGRTASVSTPDLMANAILLPGLVDSADSGPLIDLVRALDQHYPEGSIQIHAYPVARALTQVGAGQADLVFPAMRLSPEAEARLPYRFSTEAMGRVSFVLYSHSGRALTRDDLIAAAQRGNPYVIEAPPFSDWGVPTRPLVSFESAFRKIAARRIDGLLWAQEEADSVLRGLGLHGVQRIHYADFDDVFIVPRGPRGDFVDQILTRALRSLRASGQLAGLYQRVHQPFQDWQP
ncbi:MAG: ABC transporter substrate-binding protein [Pseudomonadota bacterium]